MDFASTSLKAPGKSDAPYTVYTVRFRTGSSRGSGLSEPQSGVIVGLIGTFLARGPLRMRMRTGDPAPLPR